MGLKLCDSSKVNLSWFYTRMSDNGEFQVGCLACYTANRPCTFGRLELTAESLQHSLLMSHHKSDAHRKAVLYLLGQGVGPRGENISGAPSKEQFLQVWNHLCTGSSATGSATRTGASRGGVPGVGGKEKVLKMAWCLHAGICYKDRNALMKCSTCQLNRDESAQRLVLGFSCSDDMMNVRAGMLGYCKDFGTGAAAITKATSKAFDIFCTPGYGAPPRSSRDNERNVDFQKKNKMLGAVLKNKMECIAVDSAPDEILSAEMMRGRDRGTADSMSALTPNLKHTARDLAHGSRRSVGDTQNHSLHVFLLVSFFAGISVH